ncbi:phosphodiester glycosidase family protein [Vescimonas fastidiosa]|nr:phosphodiester glycosidase family protein [Vescimonas fastidiosa]
MMRRRMLTVLLALCMVVSLIPMQVLAVDAKAEGGLGTLGIQQISEKKYAVTPDVTEYEWILNNASLTQQMMGHVMEIKVGKGSTASVAVGYGDDDIKTIQTGRNWAMTETTKQAQSMQTRRSTNVVGAINAGGYDMSNGRPTGAFIMSGTVINEPTSTTFWIDKDGNAHITSAQECNAALADGNVLEAVASFGDIFEDGHARSDLDNSTRASRTAIGIKADGTVVMMMVDGRQAPYSVGMTMAEVGATMESLGCVQAVNLDGGGSSTFATQREGESENDTSAGLTLRCRPSDGYERKVSNTIMVLSKAQPTGQFDHAVLTPNAEVYTPGSTVQFSAAGVDAAGGSAAVPQDAVWTVLSGSGRIDANSGLYTAADTCGKVTVGLKSAGKIVGQTSIQVQWPDKLGFTNTSVSIDFGQTSDLTFKPTWQGREVKYKDGDFEWSIDENGLSYKHTIKVEEYYYPFWMKGVPYFADARWYQLSLALDGHVGDIKNVSYKVDSGVVCYSSDYKIDALKINADKNGTVWATESVSHISSSFYKNTDGAVIADNIKNDVAKKNAAGTNYDYAVRGLKQTADYSFSLGQFSDNQYTADSETSVRGTIRVALKHDTSIAGQIEAVVGMEPFVLMDFEDHNGTNAKEYWSTHVGPSSAGGSGQLLPEEVKRDRLWIRDTTGKGVIFPEGYNQIVSADEDENVRFGQYAFKLGYDFTKVDPTVVAAADFGFSGDLLVNTVQPTKIGMWIKVPAACKGDNSVLKAVLKGGAFEADLATSYMKFNEDGSISYVDDKQLNGTAAYVQYYSYNTDGTVSGSTLNDWAGKDWTWVEADISSFQMPVDVARGYTVRVVSAQNCAKGSGYLYIDNLQFIYGTNTNDTTRPVLESITEKGSGTVLAGKGSTVLSSGTLTFYAVYSDSELTDKYATGIDQSGIRVLLDGTDYTDQLEINEGSLYLKGVNLRNGSHTLSIRLKDFYGNVTTETRTFRVEDAEGQRSAIDVLPQPEAPEIGKEYALSIVNNTGEPVTKAEITVDFSTMGNAAKYLQDAIVESSDDYLLTLEKTDRQAKITITRKSAQRSLLARLFGADDYVSELGYLIINIPADAAQDSKLKYTVTQGSYTIADGTENGKTYTFSGTAQEVALTAGYHLNCEWAIVGMPTELTVTNADGNAVSRATIYQVNGAGASVSMGKTNMKGKLTRTFDTAGEYTFYAEKANSGRSWNQRVIVCERTAENEGKPFGIMTNGVSEPNAKSITWLTQIDGSAAVAQVKYSTSADLSNAVTVEGTSALQTFVQSSRGDALRSNRVYLTGLQPGATYYYQVGDGETWSDTQSFKMPAEGAESTNFFILGDIQSSNTSNLDRSLRALRDSETSYDFAIQTGDAIDDVTNYIGNWRPFLNAVNSKTLSGVDMIHVMGNHEYYGDPDGEISNAIYDLPVSTENSWYKMEYGKVCVVAINNGKKLAETLADIAENLTTDCIWKVLVAHEPIYGTESVSATPEIISSIEKAGFDFVFGGDDHAYARTYPMIGGIAQPENSRGGVVYYVCGDLSGKSNEFHDRDEYAEAISHNDYTGMYLTVQATTETFTVRAIDYQGNLLDTYTERRTDCELGNHKVDASSKYDMSTGTITCVTCGTALKPTGEYAFSGLLNTTDGKQVILKNGVPMKNEFASRGDSRYHACANGYAYVTAQSDSRTCVTGGYITYTCPECGAKDRSDFQRPVDHKWDDNHICTVCHTKGIDINSKEVVFKLGTPEKPRDLTPIPSYYYSGSGVRPGSFAKRGDYVLTQNNDANLINGRIPDLYVQWPDSKNVGKAEIECEGRGDYYGSKTLTYIIVPNDVKNLKCETSTETTLTLSWSAALGAEYYEVFQCNKNNDKGTRTSLGTTYETTFSVTGLTADTDYYFVAAGRTKVPTENNEVYNSAKWSNILHARTAPNPSDVTGVSAVVDGQRIALAEVDGAKYLFLPSSTDLTKLSLTFVTEPLSDRIALSGNKGTVYWSSSVDLTAVADVNAAGYREITASVGSGQTITFRVMQASPISTVYLTSSNSAQGRDWVDRDKKNITTGSMSMVSADGGSIYSGELKQIKARGNSTFTYADKKSYQIKLNTASDLLGNQEQVKTWVLLASYFDATQMHDKLMKDLATKLGLAYTASCNWVNLYYDGEYRGVYLLSEKNSVGAASVAITDMEEAYKAQNPSYGDNMSTALSQNAYGQQFQYTKGLQEPANITGGYLIELNHNMWDEASGFKTRQGVAFNVKSPEWCGEAAMRYISEYYQDFEDAVYATDKSGAYTGYNASTGKYFYDYVDMDSLVKVFLLQELSLNCDGFISSVYFYKDADGKMFAGPIWDQDMTFGTGWTKTNAADIEDYHYLAKALIQIPAFKTAVVEYYSSTFAPAVREWLGNNGTIAHHYNLLKDSAAMNYKLWDFIRIGDPKADGHIWQGASYDSVVADMTSWIEARLSVMDKRFAQQTTLAGDVNGDGDVDIFDVYALSRYLAGYEVEGIIPANGDINGDGDVDIFDAWTLQRRLAGYND